MQTLQDPDVEHGQEPTSASTIVASDAAHSRVPTAATEVDILPIKGGGDPINRLPGDEVPPVIPLRTTDHRRTLVLCFDGTGDQFQNDNSNIVKLVSMLTKEDEDKQLVYYQESLFKILSPAHQVTNFRWSKGWSRDLYYTTHC
jgi:hypothetical protein